MKIIGRAKLCRMKLLVSISSIDEVDDALNGGASIVDVKNPSEGALGANFPWIIKDVKKFVKNRVELSATIGDLPYLPGTASLACYAVSSLGIDYVKAGLKDVKSKEEAKTMVSSLSKAIKQAGKAKLICVCYADFKHINSISPLEIPEIVKEYGGSGVMIDVCKKGLGSLTELLSNDFIKEFVSKAKELGLIVGLAGGINKENLKQVIAFNPDVIGFRRGICIETSNGLKVSKEKVMEINKMLSSFTIP